VDIDKIELDEAIHRKAFKVAFWKWFDSLHPSMRKKFNEYPADMAEIYFYNAVWSRNISNQK